MLDTILADLHCHTVASTHAYSTVTEIAQAAAERGLLAVAVTDHGVAMPDAPHMWHFANLDALPAHIGGVRVLGGVEANIVDYDGRLDMPDDMLEKLNVVVASIHPPLLKPATVEACTAAWLAVAENPQVDIIGHSGLAAYVYDYERVIPAFGRAGKAVEINEGSFRIRPASIPNCRRIAALCKQYGVPVVVDSDAHYHAGVGLAPQALAMLRELDFPPELVVNASREALERFLSARGLTL